MARATCLNSAGRVVAYGLGMSRGERVCKFRSATLETVGCHLAHGQHDDISPEPCKCAARRVLMAERPLFGRVNGREPKAHFGRHQSRKLTAPLPNANGRAPIATESHIQSQVSARLVEPLGRSPEKPVCFFKSGRYREAHHHHQKQHQEADESADERTNHFGGRNCSLINFRESAEAALACDAPAGSFIIVPDALACHYNRWPRPRARELTTEFAPALTTAPRTIAVRAGLGSVCVSVCVCVCAPSHWARESV